MQADTRETIHMGINFTMTPLPVIDADLALGVQTVLNEEGIAYATVNRTERQLVINRPEPQGLTIRLTALRQRRLGRLLIEAPFPRRPLETFIEEAEVVLRALDSVSPPDQRRVVSRTAVMRDLYGAGGVHAFQEIWETVLGQGPEALQPFGKPVRGGGLRFVIPPLANEEDPAQIELKIESFLRDTAKIFVQAHVTWNKPLPPGETLSPGALLEQVETYITQTVWEFMGAQ
jgi:hypothetical protein